MRISKWIAVLSLAYSFSARAQFMQAESIELGCVHITPIQKKYLEKHVNYSKLNKSVEKHTVEQFIKRFDGSKLYLLESDVKEIEKLMASIFDKVRGNDCSGIEKANALFVKRVKERTEYAKVFLGSKFKFDPKTQIQRDPQDRPRAKTQAEANKFHNNYMQYQVASYLATDMKEKEAREQIVRNYERVLRRVQEFKKEDLLSAYIDSYARALDPHSSYMSADNLEDFEIQMRLSLEGIGATLSTQDGFTVIEQLIPGGAAEGSGKLKVKDKIIAVAEGKDGEYKNVIEMDLRDVVKMIRGPKGSDVRLKILRKAGKDTSRFEISLVRNQIKLEDEAAAITYVDRDIAGQKLKVGLLNLPSFYADNRQGGPSAATDMKKILGEAVKAKTDAIVLDLSNNGGGSLRDAVDIAGLFFGTGNVVKQSQREMGDLSEIHYEVLRDTDSAVDWSGPLVVLISRISASASEIVSGTLQDYSRAVIVGGDHTFGKGTVQSVEYLPPGLGAIKTTVGMFFTAGGESTQHRGVGSDLIWPSVLSTDEIGEKTLDYSLPPKKINEFLSSTAYVNEGKGAWVRINKDLIKKLKDKSDPRVAASKEFKKVVEEIQKNKKNGKMIIVGDLLKEKDPTKKKEGVDGEEDETANLSREERKKKYLERADVVEAINVAADLAIELKSPSIRLGSKLDDKTSAAETN